MTEDEIILNEKIAINTLRCVAGKRNSLSMYNLTEKSIVCDKLKHDYYICENTEKGLFLTKTGESALKRGWVYSKAYINSILKQIGYSITLILTIISLLCSICSCQLFKADYRIDIDLNHYEISSDGASIEIAITANSNWMASCDEEWIDINPKNGSPEDHIIKASISTNPFFSERNCSIIVSCGDKVEVISISQARRADYVVFSPDSISFNWYQSTATVDVITNLESTYLDVLGIGAITLNETNRKWLSLGLNKNGNLWTLSITASEFIPTSWDTSIPNRTAIIGIRVSDELRGHIIVNQSFKDYIYLDKSSITAYMGKPILLRATPFLHSDINSTLTWSSSDSSVATVDNSGLITPVSPGKCFISVTAAGKYESCCNVTVYDLHEKVFVDLGLSVNWATYNVGATKPEEYGDYFAWGETTSKKKYNWETYKYYDNASSLITKYGSNPQYGIADNKTILDEIDDAASSNWGSPWRTPTREEWDELVSNCRWERCSINGINGYKAFSKKTGYTDKWIFLPAAGIRGSNGRDYEYVNDNGFYWASTRRAQDPSIYAENFRFIMGLIDASSDKNRCYGRSIRPVVD